MKNFASLALMAALATPQAARSQDEVTPPPAPPPAEAPTQVPADAPAPDLVPGATAGPADLISPGPPANSGLLPPPGALPEPGDASGTAQGSAMPRPKPNPENDKAFQAAFAGAGSTPSRRLQIDGPVITLEEALRITLARQPSIKLAQEDLEIARAGLQDAMGVFDPRLFAELTHGRAISVQPDGQILAQKEARKALIQAHKGVKDFRQGKGPGKIQINTIDDKTGEITGQQTIDITALGAGNATGGLQVNNLPQTQGGASQAELQQLIQLQQQAAVLDSVANNAESARLNRSLLDQIDGVETANKQILRDLQNGLRKSIQNFSIQETGLSNFTKYEVGLSKTFRNGINVTPKMVFDKAGLTNNVNAELEVTLPMGQGFGGHFLRAIENSAYYDVLGTELNLRHQISESLLQTSLAYWNCVAAVQNYQLLRQSERISSTFVELTNDRLESQEVAASEVSKAMARNSTISSQVIGAEFALLDARRQLAVAMGLEGVELNDPPYAAGDIPTEIPLGGLSANANLIINKSLACRADRAAAIQQMRSGKALADAAYRDIKPRFDFFFNMGVAANHDGGSPHEQFRAYTDKYRGMSAKGGFSFDWDIGNNVAKANFNRNFATFRRTEITTRDLERLITNNVLQSAAEIRISRNQLAAATNAARYNRDILGAERQRYTDGEGSLLDTLQIEEQYTNALVSIITVKLQFISAVSRLRFESGTLLNPLSGATPTTVSFSAAALTSVPNFDALPTPPPLPTVEDDQRKRPQPLLTKLRGGDGSEKKLRQLAIKPEMKYRALTDGPLMPTSAPAPVPAAALRPVQQSATPGPAKPTPAAQVKNEEMPAGKPKPLLKRLFGG